ncbi:MAG: hypothetical protein EHM93_17270 [Bacteroidales bacterium]|nr:MAG: hypothetical protein EHM93_17270 [Bacteroidales bacterium]
MKTLQTLIFLTIILLAASCKKEDVNQPPSKPKLLTPAKGAVVAPESITFTWEASTDAEGEAMEYDLAVSSDSLDWKYFSAEAASSKTIANKSGNGSYYAFETGKKYYWKLSVDSKDAGGQITGSTESDVVSFYTSPSGVANLSKTSGDGFVNLAWTDPAGLTRVEVTFSPTVIGIVQPIVVNPGVSKVELTGMQNETIYSFYIKAFNSLGHPSKADTIKALPLSPTLIHDNEFNIYSTVQVGTQTWMRENLRATKWQNGTEMKHWWSGLVYAVGPQSNIYGNYYDSPLRWEGKNPCPCGFHVPSDDEVIILERYLGVPESDLLKGGIRGELEKVGASIKSKMGWADFQGVSGNGLDLYGLNFIPAGYYDNSSKTVKDRGTVANFYTTTVFTGPVDGYYYVRELFNNSDGIHREIMSSVQFNSVRCIKD